MTQSPSTTRSRAPWGIPLVGALFAVLVLALGVLVAPSAGAAPAAVAGKNLGSVRELTVDLLAGTGAPAGLDRSGAAFRFTATGSGASRIGTCLTGAAGRCDVGYVSGKDVTGSGTETLGLPAGTYLVTQVADLRVTGLEPQPGTLATVTICDCWTGFWLWSTPSSADLDVVNDSLFQDTVSVRVVQGTKQTAVAGATFTLTGPAFSAGKPHTYPSGVTAGTAVTNAKGELTFDGPWALWPLARHALYPPGTWTLTPQDTAKYAPVSVTVTKAAIVQGALKLGNVSVVAPPPAPTPTGSLAVSVAATGPVPDGLDLSGAEFELRSPVHGGVTGTCTTGTSGACAVTVLPGAPVDLTPSGTSISLPTGTYTVRQTKAPAGLAAAPEIADQQLCVSTRATACASTLSVSNASLYRTSVQAEVTSGGSPADGVAVTLTGPGHEAVTVSTDADGVATWTGFFLPGDWTFVVEGETDPLVATMTPDADGLGAAWTVEIQLVPDTGGDTGGETGGGTGGEAGGGTGGETGGGTGGETGGGTGGETGGGTGGETGGGTGGETGGGTGGETAGGTGGETGGTGGENGGLGNEGTPVTPPSGPITTPASPTTADPGTPAEPSPAKPNAGGGTGGKPATTPAAPAPAGRPGTAPATGGDGTTSATGGDGTRVPTGGDGTRSATGGDGTSAPRTEPAPASEPEASPSAAASTDGSSAGGSSSGGSSVRVVDEQPELRTESSTQVLNVGVVTGLGILFLAVVLTGYAVLRSRSRRRAY